MQSFKCSWWTHSGLKTRHKSSEGSSGQPPCSLVTWLRPPLCECELGMHLILSSFFFLFSLLACSNLCIQPSLPWPGGRRGCNVSMSFILLFLEHQFWTHAAHIRKANTRMGKANIAACEHLHSSEALAVMKFDCCIYSSLIILNGSALSSVYRLSAPCSICILSRWFRG